MAELEFRSFEPAAFERARDLDRPVLLVITVPWCTHCKELLQTTFRNAEVQALVGAAWLPILADAERRPDVNQRYGAGGWPTIAYLTPGGELIANDGFLGAEELVPRLRKVLDAFRNHRAEIEQGLKGLWSQKAGATPRGSQKLNRRMVEDIVDAIYEKFDHRYGGWGEGSKFPHSEALDFALVQVAKNGDERMREVVTLTLDRMMEGGIHDPVDGGFFRFSKTPDWRSPNYEKMLDANARRMRCYLEAYQLFGKEGYRAAAEGVVRWMLDFMSDPETGAFFGSQEPDPDYYALPLERRRGRTPPKLDRTLYTNSNAIAVSSLLKASVVLDRPELRSRAVQVLEFLLENLHDRHGTVYHYWDGTYHLPGLLSDQAYLIRALIDASQHTGDADLLLPAERIAEVAIQRQRATGGGFYDILHDPAYSGSMRRRNRSILENSVMAEALTRLAYLSRRPEFQNEAIATLEAFTGDYKEYGYYVAGYGRAIDLIFYEPLFVTIVGDRESPEAENLRRTALSTYVPSRIVQMLDPKYDPILLSRSGYPVRERATVYLSVGRSTKAVVNTREELLVEMARIESERNGG
ncbi:MAG: thioredoxin domain-containing protein [Planctomycetes bacterium]|nr:thioredoxin domain-containing protein [Planctomycetota bacterium]